MKDANNHNDKGETYLLLLTKNGFMKKTSLESFSKLNVRGLRALKLSEGDSVGWAKLCQESDTILIATKQGSVLRFPESDISPRSRVSMGNRAIKLDEEDHIVSMDVAKKRTRRARPRHHRERLRQTRRP